jgi:hypothetical protein
MKDNNLNTLLGGVVIFLVCILFSETIHAQHRLSIQTGATLARHHIDNDSQKYNIGPIGGYSAGVYYRYRFNFGLILQAGVNYKTKGYTSDISAYSRDGNIREEAKIRLHYINTPLYFGYSHAFSTFNLTLKTGPYIGYGFDGNVNYKVTYPDGFIDKGEAPVLWGWERGTGVYGLNRWEIGVSSGITIHIKDFDISLLHTAGLNDISYSMDEITSNRVWSLSVGYNLIALFR